MRTRAANFVLLAVAAIVLPTCHSKVAVVCDKLDGCGLIERSYEECVDAVETGYEDDRIEDKALAKCVDCLSFQFCSAIQNGACGDLSEEASGEPGVCGDVVRLLRTY